MTQSWTETGEDVIETRADLRNQVGSVLEEGDMSDERREEVLNALTIGEQSVREVMIPPEEIVALSTADDPESNFRKLEDHPRTRYPLVGEDLTDFRGVVYSPALVNHRDELSSGDASFTDLAAPTMTLSPDTDVSDAIDQFQAEQQELALVIEDGTVAGMVTVTDLLEAIIGDIEDPLDQEDPAVLEPTDG
jgi:IMP dehydrogenase